MRTAHKNIWKFCLTTIFVASALLAGPLSAAENNLKRQYVVSVQPEAGHIISDSQKLAAETHTTSLPEYQYSVSLREEFRSPKIWFLSMQASDRPALDGYLKAVGVTPDSIIESLFTNSPTVGGGVKASPQPKAGHKVYVIQRDIPGIGLATVEKKIAVSKGSQKVVESLDGKIEWDHSYLTSEGTYCVYRATDPKLIKLHAEIAGIPAEPITEVEQLVRNYQF